MVKFSKKTLIRVLLLPFLLYSFYLAKVPTEIIVIFAVFLILLLIFRQKIFDFIELHLGNKFPHIHSWSGWKKKLLLILVFILILGIFKQILFFSIEQFFGVNLEQLLLENFENSLQELNN